MRAALREYGSEVVRSWWARAIFLVGGLGLIGALAEVGPPSRVSWALVVVAALIAPFRAFERVREQREELAAQLAAPEAAVLQPVFQPRLLEGRLVPSANYPVLSGTERGLVLRAGLAFALRSQPKPLDTELQRAFEDAVAASAAEGWLHELTSSIPRISEERFWRLTQPTRNNIVTVRRPAASLLRWPYTVGGWCRLNLQTSMLPGASIHGHLVLDAVLRPVDDDDPQSAASTYSATVGHPLSFEDLYVALHVLQVATIEQIADRVLPGMQESDEWLPCAYAVVVSANGGSIADYVALESRRWSRAEGSYDATGGDWYAESESALRTPAERDVQIKAWLARLLRDSGYSGFESDIDRLQPPRMPIAVPT